MFAAWVMIFKMGDTLCDILYVVGDTRGDTLYIVGDTLGAVSA